MNVTAGQNVLRNINRLWTNNVAMLHENVGMLYSLQVILAHIVRPR